MEENVHDSLQSSLTNQPASLKLRQNLHQLETICEQINQILSPLLHKSPTSGQSMPDSNLQAQAESQSNLAEGHSSSIQENGKKSSAVDDVEMKDSITVSKLKKESIALTDQELVKEMDKSPCDVPASVDPCAPQKEPICSSRITKIDLEMEEMKNDTDSAAGMTKDVEMEEMKNNADGSAGMTNNDVEMEEMKNEDDTKTDAVPNGDEITEKSHSGVIILDD